MYLLGCDKLLEWERKKKNESFAPLKDALSAKESNCEEFPTLPVKDIFVWAVFP